MKTLNLTIPSIITLLAALESTASLQAQGVHSAAAPMQVWNRTSQGMSTNAALGYYRLQNVGRPAARATAWPQYSRSPIAVNYPVNPYTADAYYPAAPASAIRKPFNNVPPHRTAFDRYWPYLLEGYEDPETGFIIWTLP